MRTSARLALAGLAATLLLSSLVAHASANRISAEQRGIKAVFRELTFDAKPRQRVQLGPIRCAVTMEGTFHRSTFAKVRDVLIGVITRAIVNHPCTEAGGKEFWFHNGTETVLGARPAKSLPWPMTYTSFRGALPLISAVNINITGIVMSVFYPPPFACLEIYGEAAETRPWVFNIGGAGIVSSLEPAAEHLIQQQVLNGACPELGKLSSASRPVTLLSGTNEIVMHLI